MMNFESVLAFGDSTPSGCELAVGLEDFRSREYMTGKISIWDVDAPGKLLAYPQIVADHFGVPCYNYAMTGGSNNRSLRLLTQAVQDHPNSLVLFGYGPTNRTEFYHPEGGLGCDQDNFFQTGPNNYDLHINRKYLEIVRPYNNLKEIMFCVDSICKLYATNFVHIPLFTVDNFDEVPDIDNSIDWGNPRKNAEVWCIENKFSKHTFHYGIDFHKALAELIIQHLIKKEKYVKTR